MFLDLKLLSALQAIARQGSFSAAAQTLGLTQSALSHQIKRAEDHFNLPLLYRNQRPVRPTPAGQHLITLADALLTQVQQSEKTLLNWQQGRQGRLHLAMECHSCFDWLIPVLEDYRADWSEIDLDLSYAHHLNPLPALQRGDIDLVLSADLPDSQELIALPLFHYQVLLALPPGHRLCQQPHISPQDLSEQTLLTYPVNTARLDIFRHFLQPAGITPTAIRQVELTLMLIQLTASRKGVCALPDWALTDALTRGQLCARPLGQTGLRRTLHAILRKGEEQQPFIQAFLNCAHKLTSHQTT